MHAEKSDQVPAKQKMYSETPLVDDDDDFKEIQTAKKMHDFDNDDMFDNKKQIAPSHKKKVQLTFKNVLIKTTPKVKKCCKGKNYKIPESRTILNDVSGTIEPGQFLAIIGASGNKHINLSITSFPTNYL